MNENSDLLPNLLHEEFEMQMRGYSRRQVDDFVARRNNEIRELEQRLARTLDESEHLRRELSTTRQQALAGRPAHEEVSERISQILKLADDEAHAQKSKADDDIAKQRAEAQQESERVRADASEQAQRMLTAAQEQAERTISAARTEADKTRTAARTEADRLTSDTRKKADAALAQAKAQAKKVLDEATARATAIHDGAERRLNLLSTRHAETVRRLSDILDGVQGLVSAEAARMSLEEEVNQTVSRAIKLAEAEEASAEPSDEENQPGDVPESERDLAMLAPPAAETVAAGTAAPREPAEARPSGPGRHVGAGANPANLADRPNPPAAPEPPPFDPFDGSVSLPSRMPAADSGPGSGPGLGAGAGSSGRGQSGRPGPTPPPLTERPSRIGAQPDGRQRAAQPDDTFSGPLGDPFAPRETKRDLPIRRTGLIDPDEPDEGLRLLP